MKNNYFLILISFFLTFVLIEIVLSKLYKIRLYEFDTIVGWDLRKNNIASRKYANMKYTIISDNYKLRTNKAKNILNETCDFDYIFLGDSFIFGVGIDIEKRFDLLFNKKMTVKSINFAVPGYSILQSYLKQKKYITKNKCINPKKLIIFIYKNDITDAQSSQTAFRYRPIIIDKKIKFPNNIYYKIHGYLRDLSYGYFYFFSNLEKFYKKNNIFNSDNLLPIVNELEYIQQDTIHNEIYIFLHGFDKELGNKFLNNKICQKIECDNTNITFKNNQKSFVSGHSHWNILGHKNISEILIDKFINHSN
tara:strand:+ start:1240 stop:2160 length:921 start_codon:yes stop_codon:yes gene_type:complete